MARTKLLAHEKELTRHRDEVNAERRRLPMIEIDKEYVLPGRTARPVSLTCSTAGANSWYGIAPGRSRVADGAHGVSAFLRVGDRLFHTYSSYARGGDVLIGTYNWLDLTALGRQRTGSSHPDAATSFPKVGCAATTNTTPEVGSLVGASRTAAGA